MGKKLKIKKVQRIISIFIYILFSIILLFSVFIRKMFDDISFEQLLYNITNTKGANYSIVLKGAIFIGLSLVIIVAIIYLVYKLYKSLKIKIYFNIGFKKKIKKIEIFKNTKLKSYLLLCLFIIASSYISCKLLNIDKYIESQLNSSKIFEEYYVSGKNIELKFPKKKRNLIYIFAESIETTNVSEENGGLVYKSYMPKLEKLALENINFSNNDKLGGAIQTTNTGWTIAALVAHTSGIPLKVAINGNAYKNYDKVFPGVYNLGDILENNGYNNYFMIGSDADFGGRKDYFEDHGNYTIYDYYYARENEMIDEDYYVWWGYEDKKLFSFAKEKILDAAKKDEPFNFTILTVDTHFTDGYMDSSCEEIFDSAYANAIYCSDSKIYSFVNWIKKQDFYKDTTIIISGDHLTMQKDFYHMTKWYQRTMYNTIINSQVKPINEKNRLFTSFDMFPTTLAALGVEIEGERLGLGTNLFSGEKTLIEKLGFEYFNTEIGKKSFYYDNVLLGDTYYKMQEELED